MSDPRIATVAAVLTETGAVQGADDTDTIATKIVNALDAAAAGDGTEPTGAVDAEGTTPAPATEPADAEGTTPAAGDAADTDTPNA